MATLLSSATGNLTGTNWSLVDATSIQTSEISNNAISTTYAGSGRTTTFTPGAITIDAIALHFAVRSATPTGTFSVALYNSTAGSDVAGTEVTVDIADLPTCSVLGLESGWIVFKMAAPVLLLAATAYSVEVKNSNANQVNLFRDATGANWSKMIRTTTTQAPVAGDVLYISGELTGSGTGNDISITMDQTATTQYGLGTDGSIAMMISKRGTLTYGTTAATNYYLKLGGNLVGCNGGTFIGGTSTGTGVLEFNPVLDGGMGFIRRNGFTCTTTGLPRTTGKNVVACKLTSNIVATNTTLNVDTDTGWLSGDEICLAKTTVSSSRSDERRNLNADAGASSMVVTSGVSNTHYGTAPYQNHVCLLTRNFIIRSATSTIMAYQSDSSEAITSFSWTKFQYMGTSSTKAMFTLSTNTGSFNAQYCSFVDSEQWAIAISTGSNNITFQNNVFYNVNSTHPNAQNAIAFGVSANSTLGANITFTDNFIIGFGNAGSGTNQNAIVLNYNTINFSRNVISSQNNGQTIAFNNATSPLGTFDDNVIYGCNAVSGGIFGCLYQMLPLLGGTINRMTAFHNSGTFWMFGNTVSNLTMKDCVFFGNATASIGFGQGGSAVGCTFNNVQLSSDSIQTSASAVSFASGTAVVKSTFINSSIGVVSGNYTDNTSEMNVSGGYADLLFNNCTFGSNTLIANQANLDSNSLIAFNKFQATTNKHQWYTKYGIASSTGAGLTDTLVRTPGSLNVRIAPIDSTTGFSWSFLIPATTNTTVSFQGFFQKNAAFGTDVCTVSLFLPGSTTADSTATLSNVTGSYQSAAVSAYYSGTDGLATVTINAKTTTANAYVYAADFYNSGDTATLYDKLAGLTIWNNGQPSPIITQINLGGVASSVWAVALSGLTTLNTTGNKLKNLKNPSLLLDGEIIV